MVTWEFNGEKGNWHGDGKQMFGKPVFPGPCRDNRRRQWHLLQCSCLENPRDRGAWWATVYGVAQSRARLKQLSSSDNGHRLDTDLNFSCHECACSVAQSCPTLCDPVDCSLPGSSVHGTFQARILEWFAISSFRGSSWPRNQTPSPASPALQTDSLPLSHLSSPSSTTPCPYSSQLYLVIALFLKQTLCLNL